jgi:hypothetical protein
MNGDPEQDYVNHLIRAKEAYKGVLRGMEFQNINDIPNRSVAFCEELGKVATKRIVLTKAVAEAGVNIMPVVDELDALWITGVASDDERFNEAINKLVAAVTEIRVVHAYAEREGAM